MARPCRQPCGCGGVRAYAHWTWPDMAPWRWLDECGRSCGCPGESVIELAGYPVRAIVQVKIDGAVIDPSEYELIEDRNLVRLSDPGPPLVHRRWPGCQDVTLPDTEAGTFSIMYTWGAYPPQSGKDAAAQLAAEMFRACQGDAACKLPQGTTRVTRQGVTIERAPLAEFLAGDKGTTGLVFVDAFLGTYNSQRMRRGPAIWSPDLADFPRVVG